MTDADALSMLRASAREWVASEHPVAADHAVARGAARIRWRDMAQLGWTGLTIAGARGGLALGLDAYAVIAEELGRELVDSPLLSTSLLASTAIDEQCVLDRIISGETIVGIALDGEGPRGGPRASAARSDGGWRVRADKRFVLDGALADWFLVSAQADAPELFLVPANVCSIVPVDTIDGRAMAHLTIDARVDASALLPGGEALLERLADLARLGLAMEMQGAARRAFEITLEYLKTREQFGRPIGSFQALQHRAAIMLVEIEVAGASLAEAVAAVDAGDPEARPLATLAKYVVGRALHGVTNEMVQMHGGIGMTAEHVAGRYLKWARVSEALFGDAPSLARRYADASGF